MSTNDKGPYVVGFNGPPRAGKDTLADILAGQLGRIYNIATHRCVLAAPMRARVEALVGDGRADWYEQNKDLHLELLGDQTPRRCMIRDSEEFLKPAYGRDFWAKIYHYRNRHWWDLIPSVVIVSDIGFQEECQYFVEHSRQYLNVRLARTGTDFSNDSRNYVDTIEGALSFPLSNDSYPMAAVETLIGHIASLNWTL